MLDILVFTDATSAESLSGSPGFQFVAHSPGATPTDESVVRQRLQHSVPTSLAVDDWGLHPATCAYARVGERMYLSRGLSTGATLGGRPGNQLTVTLMTSDPFDVLPLRPAQLFSSSRWDFARPTARELVGWQTPVDIDDDFDIPGLHALVVHDPWAVEVLPAALTMLEQTQAERRTRLFVRHPDQAVVMRWVALLSRFLDADSALGLEFRVFTDDPLRMNAHIVGVHPRLAPDITVATAGDVGANVLDLERRELSPITISESAARYARWFVSGDPYEALEAIEVGRRWSRHMDSDVAAAAAELAAMESSRGEIDQRALHTSLTAITTLAGARELNELEAYGDQLVDVAASCPPTGTADLLSIGRAMWAVEGAGDDELAQSLALAALEWTAAQPELFADWAAAARPNAALTWHDRDARAHAASLLATSLKGVRRESLPSTFALAKALETGVSADAISSCIRDLADLWLTDPSLTDRARDWVQSRAVVDRLARDLDALLTAGDPAAERSLTRGSWDWLAPTPWRGDPASPVTRWLVVRELRGAGPQQRADLIGAVRATLPSNAWRVILPTTTGLDPDEVVGWIEAHGELDQTLAAEVQQVLAQIDRFPAWQRTGGAKVLHQIGQLGAGTPPGLQAAVDVQAEIMALFTQASQSWDQPANAALRTLGHRFQGRLNSLYGDWVANAVLQSEDTRAAVALAEGPGRNAVVAIAQALLEEELRSTGQDALISAVRLLHPGLGPWNTAATNALDAIWDDRKTGPIREGLLSSVQGRLRPEEQDRLDRYLDAQSKGRFARGVLRGAKSVLGKDNDK